MRKWLIAILVLVLLFLAFVYLFIPKNILITKSLSTASNQSGTFRFLSDQNNWQLWWPENKSSQNENIASLQLEGFQFDMANALYNSFNILIEKNKRTDTAFIHLIPAGIDSTKLICDIKLKTGVNPFHRINQYFNAKELDAAVSKLLGSMASFLDNPKNIYGLDIKNEKVKVEYLVATKKTFDYLPTTENIYEMITDIKNYIRQSGANEDDFPMLNVNSSGDSVYEVQVVIPVNKKLPETGIFSSKRMLKNGDILVAQVTGGKTIIDSAMKKMDLYANDHHFVNIAIPFESLITDRSKEKDSGKWITKIYYPVIK